MLTLLQPDRVGGLEVRAAATGEWFEVSVSRQMRWSSTSGRCSNSGQAGGLWRRRTG